MGCWPARICNAVGAAVEWVDDVATSGAEAVVAGVREVGEIAGERLDAAAEGLQRGMAWVVLDDEDYQAFVDDAALGEAADREIAVREAIQDMTQQAAEVLASKRQEILDAADGLLDKVEQVNTFMERLTDDIVELGVMPQSLKNNRATYGTFSHYTSNQFQAKLKKMNSYNESASTTTSPIVNTWLNQIGKQGVENNYDVEWIQSDAFFASQYGSINASEGSQTTTWWGEMRFRQWCWFANGSNFPLSSNDLFPDFKIHNNEPVEGYPHGWLTALASLYFGAGYFTHNSPWDPQAADAHQVAVGDTSTQPWGCFTARQVTDFRSGQQSFVGYENIMQHNHGGKKAMAPMSFFDYDNPTTEARRGTAACENADLDVPIGIVEILRHASGSVSFGTIASGDAFEVMRYEGGFPRGFSSIHGILNCNMVYGQTPLGDKDYQTEGHQQLPTYNGAQYVWALPQTCLRLIKMGQLFKATDIEGAEELGELLMNSGNAMKGLFTEISGFSRQLREIHEYIQKELCKIAANSPAFPQDWADNWNSSDAQDAYTTALQNMDNLELEAMTETFTGEGQQAQIFKEQCFLLSFIADIAAYKKYVADLPDFENGEPVEGTALKHLPYFATDLNPEPLEMNSTLLMDGESYSFLNLLTQHPSMSTLHEIRNHELSNLQPRLRLWKVIFDDEGNEREVEISFDTHMTAEDMETFRTSPVRGVGAGVKSFNFVYDGSNPFSVKKSIKGNLKIFANSFIDLLAERRGYYYDTQVSGEGANQTETVTKVTEFYRYLDLVMKTWNTNLPPEEIDRYDTAEQNVNRQELNFRLKAQIGLSVPVNEMSSMRSELRDALSESFVTLNLTPTVHDFEIDEQGRVILNINYLAYIEQFFDSKMFNVFADPDVSLNRFKREFQLKTHRKNCGTEEINQLKEDFAQEVDQETGKAISSLMKEMMLQDKIYYIALEWGTVRDFLSRGPHATYSEMNFDSNTIQRNAGNNVEMHRRVNRAMTQAFGQGQEGGVSGDDETMNSVRAALLGNNPEGTDIAYFYISDLLDIVLVKIEKELVQLQEELETLLEDNAGDGPIENMDRDDIRDRMRDLRNAATSYKTFRLLLGPVEFTHPAPSAENASVFVNLGDVPIAVKYFVGWLTERMLRKDEVVYPLTKFVNDLLNNLVRTFLNNDECFGYSVKQKTRIHQSAITCYSDSDEYDPLTLRALELRYEPLGEGASAGARGFVPRTNITEYPQRPILNVSGPDGARTTIPIDHAYNFFVFYAGRVMPRELQTGNKAVDEASGIFHYAIGRDRGLIKNIKLTKTQIKGLAEVRFEQEGFDNLEQLRVVYDAQVDMFANVHAFPGTYIFIDPKGFDPAMPVGLSTGDTNELGTAQDPFGLTDLGIGGYYMVVRSEHEFAEGKANTILSAKWVAALDSDEQNRQDRAVQDGTGDGTASNRNCSIELRPDPAEDFEGPGFLDMVGGALGADVGGL